MSHLGQQMLSYFSQALKPLRLNTIEKTVSMHRLSATLRQVRRENENITVKTAFKDGPFTQSIGDPAPCSRVTLLSRAHVLDYASVTVAPSDLEALGAERQRDVLAGVIASLEIYNKRLPLRPPHFFDFPLTALFVE